MVLLIILKMREKREADPLTFRAKGAGRRLMKDLRAAQSLPEAEVHAAVLKALQDYLGSKLKLPAAVLSFADVEEPLESKGVPKESRALLKELLDACEAERFAGAAPVPGKDVLDRALSLAGELERRLG